MPSIERIVELAKKGGDQVRVEEMHAYRRHLGRRIWYSVRYLLRTKILPDGSEVWESRVHDFPTVKEALEFSAALGEPTPPRRVTARSLGIPNMCARFPERSPNIVTDEERAALLEAGFPLEDLPRTSPDE